MSKPATQAERLAALETSSAMHFEALMEKLDDIAAEQKAQRRELDALARKLAAVENKGKGILIGVGIAGTGLGAWISSILEWFK